MPQFETPSQFKGRTLRQIQRETGIPFRSDVVAKLLGTGEDVPLGEGQAFNVAFEPGHMGSSEQQFLQGSFAPGGTFAKQQQQPFVEEQRGRQEEFLGGVRRIPETLQALEQELGIPGARETYAEAGGAAREVAGQIRGIPEVQRGATRGFDVTQNQLARMIAQKTQELQPSAEIATRGLEEAGAGLTGLLGAFQTRAANVLAPFQIEAGMLGESAKNEFDLLKTQMSSALDRELETMRQTGATDRENIQRATELARIEANEGELVNLGDRVAWMIDGKEVSSTPVGLAPLRPTAGGGDVWV